MDLLIFAIINPYKAFLKIQNINFTIITLMFLLGVSFFYFGFNELEHHFYHINSIYPYYKIHLPIVENIQTHLSTFERQTLFYFITIIFSYTLVFVFNIFFIISGTFLSNHYILNSHYLKISFIFSYSLIAFFFILKALQILLNFHHFDLLFLGVFVLLMTILYSSLYELYIIKAFFSVIKLFISIILLIFLCYGIYLIIFSNSIEKDFMHKINTINHNFN